MTTTNLTLSEKKKLVRAAREAGHHRAALMAEFRKEAERLLSRPCGHTEPGEKGPAVAGCQACLKGLLQRVALHGFKEGVACFYRPPKPPPSVIVAESIEKNSPDAEVPRWRAEKLVRLGLVLETEPNSCLYVCKDGVSMEDVLTAMPAIGESLMYHW